MDVTVMHLAHLWQELKGAATLQFYAIIPTDPETFWLF